MASVFCRSKILLLRGVFPQEIMTVKHNIEVQPDPQTTYNEIPKRFTSVDEWPKASNLKCWTCDRIPHSYPRFLPLNVRDDTCDVHGNFCRWGCVVSYVMKEYSQCQQCDLLYYICVFESKFTGTRRLKILPTPPKILMKEYCGNNGITEKEWAEKADKIDAQYSLPIYTMAELCNYQKKIN